MESNLQDTSLPPREFPLEFLQLITNNFSEDSIIGEGGFGVVYKVRLLITFSIFLPDLLLQTSNTHVPYEEEILSRDYWTMGKRLP